MRLSKRTTRLLKEAGKKYKFGIDGIRFIRTKESVRTDYPNDNYTSCPICAIAYMLSGMRYCNFDWPIARKDPAVNIPYMEAEQIVSAADNPEHPYRRYLMKHLGMES